MSIIAILETLLIGPIKLIYEIIFYVANYIMRNPGKAIILFSLVVNLLVLPLYRRADAMQEAARDNEARLQKGVSHIKKTFSGDERMMILQTYYKQNNYKPTDALNGSVSLLLEIPFFMAAYQFLSNLQSLDGASLGPIANLAVPDGLLVIGGLTINLLPILMTLVNVISSAIYLKGFPLKTKIQLYAMALFFLVFLYNSPSGLVFYWTLNNVFSLVKTIFYKVKNPRRKLCWLCTILGTALLVLAIVFHQPKSMLRRTLSMCVGAMLQLPLLISLLLSRFNTRKKAVEHHPNRRLFIMGSLFLTVLIGLQIPSTFIAASPQEFVFPAFFYHPLNYVLSAGCLAAGTFLIWMRIFYWLASPKAKIFFERLVWVFCGIALMNYMFFGTKLGILSPNLQYDNDLKFEFAEHIINIAITLPLIPMLYFIVRKWSKAATAILLTASIALGCMSGMNAIRIKDSIANVAVEDAANEKESSFRLSKTGKNVIVMMLDRGSSPLVPYIFKEKPELREQFEGFTFYDNAISFGHSTIYGAAPLYGGYEYTPVEMNKRDSEALVSKHNEALKVMPVLFSENDYEVTVCDPPYANYQWLPDLSIYDAHPEINAFNTDGHFLSDEQADITVEANLRNFFCFALMKSLPVSLQEFLYLSGTYGSNFITQVHNNPHTATGIFGNFMNSFNVLTNLSTLSEITDEETNTFLAICNNTTHQPTLLQTPDYIPQQIVDNREYDAANTDRFILEDGRKLDVSKTSHMMHYHIHMTTFLQLGKWFDYLRENGVYDNTRIIIAADHGYSLPMQEELLFGERTDEAKNGMSSAALLLVKDFDSHEFTVSHEFMTNGDVPILATNDLIENPVNPFTGKVISNDEKYAHDQIIILSEAWEPSKRNITTFPAAHWASVHDDIWNAENWDFSTEENTVLTEYKLP